jgi:hypothetical protein
MEHEIIEKLDHIMQAMKTLAAINGVMLGAILYKLKRGK